MRIIQKKLFVIQIRPRKKKKNFNVGSNINDSETIDSPNIIVLGRPGHGKSTFLNYLAYKKGVNEKGQQLFKAMGGYKSCTKNVSKENIKVYGTSYLLNVHDVPGIFAIDYNLDDWVNEIKSVVGSINFLAVCIVARCNERPDVQDMIIPKAVQIIMTNLNINNIILILTKYDVMDDELKESSTVEQDYIDFLNEHNTDKTDPIAIRKVLFFW